MFAARPASAQVLQAKWVDESQERIEEIRKADVRVIVIDKEGNPVPNCPVRIEQKQHAFLFGVRLPREMPKDVPGKSDFAAAPVWRAFNAIALDSVASWPATQPKAGEWDFTKVEQYIAWAHERKLAVRWGGVVSTDPGRMPAWAAGLRGDELRIALESHTREVIQRFSRHVNQFDLVTDLLDHHQIESELGLAGIRRLYALAESERAVAARNTIIGQSSVAFSDAFAPDRLQKALRTVTRLREGFVPVEAIAVEVRFTSSIVEAPITRNLSWMGDPGLPVMVTNMEVAGASKAEAVINLETALRAMFAQPSVKGIYLAGLRGRELHDENAALLDEQGYPTEAGILFDRMTRQFWWTDLTQSTDELGNVKARIFAGTHQLTATLPDGSIADTQVRIGPGETKLILLQPVKAERKPAEFVKTDDMPKTDDKPVTDTLVKPIKDVAVDNAGDQAKPKAAPIEGRPRLEFAPDR